MNESALPRTASTGAGRGLPLTEPHGQPLAGTGGEVSEDDIRRLVDSFYVAARDDGLLGPVFAVHVKDWSVHLPRMYDFWSTVVLRTGRYSGRPIDAHLALPNLTHAHFERWLSLWETTVARVIPRAAREAFVSAAHRMGASMSFRILGPGLAP